MNTHCASRIAMMFGLVLSFAAVLSAQSTTNPANKTLVVNGKVVSAGVRQINGRSYIDVETLAQATNGVVTVEPNRVVLTIPGASSTAPAGASAFQFTGALQNFRRGRNRRSVGNERVARRNRGDGDVRIGDKRKLGSGLSQPRADGPHAASVGCVD